ncbi:MAG: formylglycine-generating enzyme family protein [Planctomycetota bacterium]
MSFSHSRVVAFWLLALSGASRAFAQEAPEATQSLPSKADKYTNDLGMEFVRIAPGTFAMGSDRGEDSEKPVHQVTLTKAFFMQATEVTVGQFRTFVADTGYRTTAEREGGAHVQVDGSWEEKKDAAWDHPYLEQEETHPVVCVSWHDAVAFADWLSKETGETFRLPTEAEWEYACRAGSTPLLPWGDSVEGDACWYEKNAAGRTHPVATKRRSAWGLCDMIGNAAEWCADWYAEGYSSSSAVSDPAGPGEGTARVVRGGCWGSVAEDLRASARAGGRPDFRSPLLGFRLVMVRNEKKDGN